MSPGSPGPPTPSGPGGVSLDVVVVVFDGVTAAEAVGPSDVLRQLPDVDVRFVADRRGAQLTHGGAAPLVADATFAEVDRADVLLVPGGIGVTGLVEDWQLLSWLRSVHRATTWTAAVSTGSVVLAAAGILTGVAATTHWLAMGQLAMYGANPVAAPIVSDGKIITATGDVSAVRMALQLAARIAGPAVAAELKANLLADDSDSAAEDVIASRWY